MTIVPVAAELFHEDGRTDIPKITVAFRNFPKAPKHSYDRRHIPFSDQSLIATGYPILDLQDLLY